MPVEVTPVPAAVGPDPRQAAEDVEVGRAQRGVLRSDGADGAAPVAKGGSARWIYVPASVIADLVGYAEIDRAKVVADTAASGRYRSWHRLAGQPTLKRQLRLGTFAALDQRIASRFTIKPMDLAESAAYLKHHLTLAGRDEPLFADDAIARLHRVANGLPRALNNAAVAALIAAAADGKNLIDDACAKKAVAELTRD